MLEFNLNLTQFKKLAYGEIDLSLTYIYYFDYITQLGISNVSLFKNLQNGWVRAGY